QADSPATDPTATRVAESLRESGQLKNYRVGVKYEDGVAWLVGSVTSQEQADTALRLAAEVEGVDHVVNKLEIVAPAPVASAPVAPAAPQRAEQKPGEDLLLTMLEAGESAAPQAAPAPLPPVEQAKPVQRVARRGAPRPMRRMAPQPVQQASAQQMQYRGMMNAGGTPPQGYSTAGAQGVAYDQANMPGYAWPSYAASPNYAAVTYPKQYSPAAWPYIGPFYPYPQVPLGWRKVTLEWDDGWWYLDFSHQESH
ncbi:MAG: BON domain-containing protein, partial [Planctomycetota bacterium]